MKCPKCNSEILKENINIQSDIAQCIHCDNIFKISDTVNAIDDGFNINDNPSGTWIRKDFDNLIIGATTRSPIAFFLVPFMIVWSGFSIGGIYGSQIVKGEFNPTMSLFGIPFIIGSIIFWALALMAIWGKVELVLDKNGGKIFTGIGNLGLTKRFDWSEISSIKEVQSIYNYPGSTGGKIQLEGRKRVSFGLGVKESRRYYLYKTIQKVHSNIKMRGKF
jgi:hypothetical protein